MTNDYSSFVPIYSSSSLPLLQFRNHDVFVKCYERYQTDDKGIKWQFALDLDRIPFTLNELDKKVKALIKLYDNQSLNFDETIHISDYPPLAIHQYARKCSKGISFECSKNSYLSRNDIIKPFIMSREFIKSFCLKMNESASSSKEWIKSSTSMQDLEPLCKLVLIERLEMWINIRDYPFRLTFQMDDDHIYLATSSEKTSWKAGSCSLNDTCQLSPTCNYMHYYNGSMCGLVKKISIHFTYMSISQDSSILEDLEDLVISALSLRDDISVHKTGLSHKNTKNKDDNDDDDNDNDDYETTFNRIISFDVLSYNLSQESGYYDLPLSKVIMDNIDCQETALLTILDLTLCLEYKVVNVYKDERCEILKSAHDHHFKGKPCLLALANGAENGGLGHVLKISALISEHTFHKMYRLSAFFVIFSVFIKLV